MIRMFMSWMQLQRALGNEGRYTLASLKAFRAGWNWPEGEGLRRRWCRFLLKFLIAGWQERPDSVLRGR